MKKRQMLKGISLVTGMMLLPCYNLAMAVNLGSAGNFGALAGSGITFAASGQTTITGDIGSYATLAITGLENLKLNGVNHAGDAVTQQAKTDLSAAYLYAQLIAPTVQYDAGAVALGGRTLTKGVYKSTSSFGITSDLTLDAEGHADATWIFQSGSTLDLGVNSKIILLNGAKAENVVWQVGSSATIGTDAYFTGTILALSSITVNTRANVMGGLLAQNGAVTFDNNTVMVPEVSTVHLLALGLVVLLVSRRRIAACL